MVHGNYIIRSYHHNLKLWMKNLGLWKFWGEMKANHDISLGDDDDDHHDLDGSFISIHPIYLDSNFTSRFSWCQIAFTATCRSDFC
jgi:hypothetical protein